MTKASGRRMGMSSGQTPETARSPQRVHGVGPSQILDALAKYVPEEAKSGADY